MWRRLNIPDLKKYQYNWSNKLYSATAKKWTGLDWIQLRKLVRPPRASCGANKGPSIYYVIPDRGRGVCPTYYNIT